LKTDIEQLGYGLNTVLKLNPVSYLMKEDLEGGTRIGFIAQELRTELPELVTEDERGMLAVKYTELIPVLTKAIQELKAEKEELQKMLVAEIAKNENKDQLASKKDAEFEQRLADLENLILQASK